MKLCINSALRCASKGAGYLERRGVEGCKHVQRAGGKKEEVLPGNTRTANTHDRMMKHTELHMLPKQC